MPESSHKFSHSALRTTILGSHYRLPWFSKAREVKFDNMFKLVGTTLYVVGTVLDTAKRISHQDLTRFLVARAYVLNELRQTSDKITRNI